MRENDVRPFVKKSRIAILLCVILALGNLWHVRSVNNETTQTGDVDTDTQEKDYIKWVEFNVTCEAMKKAYQYDLDTYGKEVHLNWVSLLAYLGAKYGGDFGQYKAKDMDEIAELMINGEKTEDGLAQEMQYYSYYREAYGAVLDGMVGEYQMEYAESTESEKTSKTSKESEATAGTGETADESGTAEESKTAWKTVYGLKAFHPIAKSFPYSDYDDFGVSRTYGYRRNHLGHDMMGQVGTPVIAVESGYVAELGWNQYGGWRIGINSFDGKRYYYYAHLRQNRPYAEGLEKGDIVQAGDVIGYMGRTGYSTEENVNNIDEYHLHFGLQLIFDESQREGNNEIWVSGFELVKFLYQHQSEVQRNDETKEWTRVYQIKDPVVEND
ncbi:MAG: M23 family metallopeptidase [Tyzzerella sp.]|nr:M23 family metallopeptidase [Tyzzerella sp.]